MQNAQLERLCTALSKQLPWKETHQVTETLELLVHCFTQSKNLVHGMCLHYLITSCGQDVHVSVGSLLAQFYIKCGHLEDARSSFSHITERHINAWNSMIGAYAHHGKEEEALKTFRQMQQESVLADKITLLTMLSACTDGVNVIDGRQIHVQIGSSLVINDVVVATALVNMYGKIGVVQYAWNIFSDMNIRNVISWSSMIALCSRYGRRDEALSLFYHMLEEGVLPNSFTFMSLFSACSCLSVIKDGKEMHARLMGSEFESHPYMWNALTNMYGRWGDLDKAVASFDGNCKEGVSSWNIILAAHVHHGKPEVAIEIFDKMSEEGIVPDKATFTTILSVYSNHLKLTEGMNVHNLIIIMGFESDNAVLNSLVNMYGKCKCYSIALKLLRKMSENDVVSWNTLISGYAEEKLDENASATFQQMMQEGIAPNEITYSCILDAFASEQALVEGKRIHARVPILSNVVITTALVNMYGNCGSFNDALRTFRERIVQNVLLWNSTFAVCNQYERGEEVLELFAKMYEEKVMPDHFTFANVLSACSSHAGLSAGRKIHALAVEHDFMQDTVVGTALVNMYSKCGSLDDARGMFDSISFRDVIIWSAIINAYAQHGHGKEAVKLFYLMRQARIVPNKVTYVSVLSACSHAGLVVEGRKIFASMKDDHGITPTREHCDCMVNLLARSGLLDEAEELIKTIPFSSTYVAWTTILGACRNEGDIERGERIGKHLIDLYPENACPYVLLSQIFTLAGRDVEAANILEMMKEKTFRKQKSYSSIETNCCVHTFFSDDQSHINKDEVYATLMKIETELRDAGYIIETLEMTEEDIGYIIHSELLAITFGIISTTAGTPLLITKNIRTCNKCHSFLKILSKLYQRQIVLRDASRFHRINDGICSCGDYW